MRASRNIEDLKHRNDIQTWIRGEFKSKKHLTDKVNEHFPVQSVSVLNSACHPSQELIAICLSSGRDSLRDLQTSLTHAHAIKH